ncbi:hypothetical protein [Ectopseudomonas alcaliphila]|uniref:Uncharacterized protein n=1 Tax=Ectopseudomonas alcaliphila TaxID=101564 RepID=A0A1G7MKF5_9GAMM|nr:hypothetical protein [Pseudomonas alcaliphila]MDX5994943.1 hypothetical protein [Pseudomonas alcaliphila]SDF62144.1 hypothetical protein SAMN05216575_10976 [Pseudomonas alcaliphila]
MTNPIKQADQALVDRLGQITPANGYLTDAGTRIKEGWLSDLMQSDDLVFPFIAKQPGLYVPGSWGQGAVLTRVGRRIVGAVDGSRDDYLEQLEELYCDLVACLQVPEGIPNPWGPKGPRQVTLEPGQMFPPGEGLAAGTVLFPLQLHIHINAGRTP